MCSILVTVAIDVNDLGSIGQKTLKNSLLSAIKAVFCRLKSLKLAVGTRFVEVENAQHRTEKLHRHRTHGDIQVIVVEYLDGLRWQRDRF